MWSAFDGIGGVMPALGLFEVDDADYAAAGDLKEAEMVS
jgi:hypothetical protein